MAKKNDGKVKKDISASTNGGQGRLTLEKVSAFCRPYRIEHGASFRLKQIDPKDTAHQTENDKSEAAQNLRKGVNCLASLQEKLYAQAKWGILLIFQAMDAAGKDSCIKHVMSGVNPQGCQVFSFKAPSHEELRHDYLWRCGRNLPERGRIGIFNRSYYEEVLVTKVHPEILDNQNIPPSLVGPSLWNDRYEDIGNFERFLSRNGFVILKFFLHVSREEQKQRFLSRLDDSSKNWKFEISDLDDRARWNYYADAYETMIQQTASPHAPWYVIPADNKWFTREVVVAAVVDAMTKLDLRYPDVSDKDRAAFAKARETLMNEKSAKSEKNME